MRGIENIVSSGGRFARTATLATLLVLPGCAGLLENLKLAWELPYRTTAPVFGVISALLSLPKSESRSESEKRCFEAEKAEVCRAHATEIDKFGGLVEYFGVIKTPYNSDEPTTLIIAYWNEDIGYDTLKYDIEEARYSDEGIDEEKARDARELIVIMYRGHYIGYFGTPEYVNMKINYDEFMNRLEDPDAIFDDSDNYINEYAMSPDEAIAAIKRIDEIARNGLRALYKDQQPQLNE